MLRFFFAVFINIWRIVYLVPLLNLEAKYTESFSDKTRYGLLKYCIRALKRTARIRTIGYGRGNLPKTGGYVMYPNPQGKYDVLGIMDTHDEPCSFVMDEEKSNVFFIKQVVNISQSKRLKIDDIRQNLRIVNEVSDETARGRKYIIFPEGGYTENGNHVLDFKPGSFKCAVKGKVPIVPVALIDSYRVFGENSLRLVTTQVHYLRPIAYDEYKDMTTQEIAEIVKKRIESVVRRNDRRAQRK
jgi:1-acyl-sn-glycerol-3-phosphate acyltransferase